MFFFYGQAMAGTAKSNTSVRSIFKVFGFLSMILLGGLGLRGYKNSVEKMKINACMEQINEIVRSVQSAYKNEQNYASLDYKMAVKLRLFPDSMRHKGFSELVNSYMGGVDIFYSSLEKEDDARAFEVSFQGLSSMGCHALMMMPWHLGEDYTFVAVAGYPQAMPSGVLDGVLRQGKQEDIKNPHIFRSDVIRFASSDKIDNLCMCKGETCTVIWKFF